MEVIHDGVLYDNEETKQIGDPDKEQDPVPLEGRDTALSGGRQSRAEFSLGLQGSTAYLSGAADLRDEPCSPTPPPPTLRSMTMGTGMTMVGTT